ncbi:MAG: hypothetical protein P8X59_03260 [Woeseiaceae bacterium]|jgi:hypothetical protein
MARKELQFLITGCGRSGTSYMAKVLQAYGIGAGNERIGAEGVVGWQFAFDTSVRYVKGRHVKIWLIRPDQYSFRRIFHQVREPVKVISSCHTIMAKNWRYIRRHIPIEPEDSLTMKCMKYWYYWNQAAQQRAEYTYRIEDLDQTLNRLLRDIGHPELCDRDDVIGAIARNTNTRKDKKSIGGRSYRQLTLADLQAEDEQLTAKIIDLAGEYGYDVSQYAVTGS